MIPIAIIVPCLIVSISIFLTAYWNASYEAYVFWAVPPFALAVGTFIIRNGINEWWYARRPPRLADIERDILAKNFPYYRRLSAEQKSEFERRLTVFRLQKQFQMRGAEKIPGDIQLLVSASAVQLTMGLPFQKEFYPRLGMVVMFPGLFITPELRDQVHAIEFNQDIFNCLLLSVNMFVKGLQEPQNYYNIGIYGFAKAWRVEHNILEADMPIGNRTELLAKLHLMRGFDFSFIFQYTALGDMEVFEMCVEHFFAFPVQMQAELPEMYQYLANLFKQDPANTDLTLTYAVQ